MQLNKQSVTYFWGVPDSLFISVILPFVFAFPFPPEATTLFSPCLHSLCWHVCGPKPRTVLHDFDLWAVQIIMDESHRVLSETDRLQRPHNVERLWTGQ